MVERWSILHALDRAVQDQFGTDGFEWSYFLGDRVMKPAAEVKE